MVFHSKELRNKTNSNSVYKPLLAAGLRRSVLLVALL
jgi:hypothetical protein